MLIFPSQSGDTGQIATSLRSSPSSCISPSIELIILSTCPALGGRQRGHRLAEQHRCRGPSPRASQGQLLLSPGRGTVPGGRQTDARLCDAAFVQASREGPSSLPSPVPAPARRGGVGSSRPKAWAGRVRATGQPCLPDSERSPARRASPCRPPVRTACSPGR